MPKRAAILAVVALGAGGCSGATRTVSITRTAPPVTRPATPPAPLPDEVLAVPAIGRFVGRCPRRARRWTLRFIVPPTSATDTISYTVGDGPVRRVNVNPGAAATFRLVAGTVRTPEPADRISAHPATTVATTPPLNLHISQATEPQFLRVDVRLALATIGGGTGQCVLVGSRIDARTYFNSAR